MISYNVPINAQRMTIGVQGENNVREFLFDVTEWRQLTGNIGAAEMVVQRNGDSSPYATVITMKDENTVSWVPSDVDTAKAGVGKIELMWITNNQTVKTKIFLMKVDPSLPYAVPDDSLDPWASWMPNILNADARVTSLEQTTETLRSQLASPFAFKGTVDAIGDLPSSSNKINDTYYVREETCLYTWNGQSWGKSSLGENEYLSIIDSLQNDVNTHTGYVCDAAGNVFAKTSDMLEWREQHKCDVSVNVVFGDCVNYAYNQNLEKIRMSSSNVNHPIPYDDSIYAIYTLESEAQKWDILCYFGYLNNGVFEPVKSVNRANPTMFHIKSYVLFLGLDTNGLYIAFGLRNNDGRNLSEFVEVKRTNPYCELEPLAYTYLSKATNDDNTEFFHGDNGFITYYSDPPNHTKILRPGAEWLYCNGLCIDAVFYDSMGQAIDCDVPVGDLGPAVSGTDYPVAIKVPQNASTFRLAIYGIRNSANTFFYFGQCLGVDLKNIAQYCRNEKSYAKSKNSGLMIKNARRLAELTYNAPGLRNLIRRINYPRGGTPSSSSNPKPYKTNKYTGIPYSSILNPNYRISWYTFFAAMSNPEGITALSYSAGSGLGFTCVAYVSMALGLPLFYQGTDYWLQNYSDKLEKITKYTEFEPGDILVKTKYMFCKVEFDDNYTDYVKYYVLDKNKDAPITGDGVATGESFDYYCLGFINSQINPSQIPLYEFVGNSAPQPFIETLDTEVDENKIYYYTTVPKHRGLNTHIIIVGEQCNDPKTGAFNGYLVYDETTASSYIRSRLDMLIPNYWRLPYQYVSAKSLEDAYIFNIDKELDTLNNYKDISVPPILSFAGDRVIFGKTTETHENEDKVEHFVRLMFVETGSAKHVAYKRNTTIDTSDPAYGDPRLYSSVIGNVKNTASTGLSSTLYEYKNGNFVATTLEPNLGNIYYVKAKGRWKYTVAGTIEDYAFMFYLDEEYDKITIKKGNQTVASDIDVSTLPDYNYNEKYTGKKSFNLSDYFQDRGEYTISAGKTEEEASQYANNPKRTGHFLWPDVPAIEFSEDFKRITLYGDMSLWDTVILSVVPFPTPVAGYPSGRPWGNYISVDAKDYIVDATNDTLVIDIGDDYQFISKVDIRNNDYGSLNCILSDRYNFTFETVDDYDYGGDDDGTVDN